MTCKVCGEAITVPRRRTLCSSECFRKWERQSLTDRRSRFSDFRKRAHAIVQREMEGGRLLNLAKGKHDIACEDCGEPARCWDHRDYSQPLAVSPTCVSCNKLRGAGKYGYIDEAAA